MTPFVNRKYAPKFAEGDPVLVRRRNGFWERVHVVEYDRHDKQLVCITAQGTFARYRWPWPDSMSQLVIDGTTIRTADGTITVRVCEDAQEAADYLQHFGYKGEGGTNVFSPRMLKQKEEGVAPKSESRPKN